MIKVQFIIDNELVATFREIERDNEIKQYLKYEDDWNWTNFDIFEILPILKKTSDNISKLLTDEMKKHKLI